MQAAIRTQRGDQAQAGKLRARLRAAAANAAPSATIAADGRRAAASTEPKKKRRLGPLENPSALAELPACGENDAFVLSRFRLTAQRFGALKA